MTTVAFCEIDPYARAVLAKHWPHVPCYDDVRTVTADRLRADGIGVDVICGGFPCQPFSSAARGRNLAHRDLWPEMRRLVAECRPTWVCGENVTAIDGVALERVVSDMEALGYEVATFVIPACAVGFDHRRDRYWILGYADQNRKPGSAVDAQAPRMQGNRNVARRMGTTYGLPGRMDRMRLLGNALVPDIPEQIGRAIIESESMTPLGAGARGEG